MTAQNTQPNVEEAGTVEANTNLGGLNVAASTARRIGKQPSSRGPRIALLTPYNGGNLGDAAIQDAMIANLRLRLPDAQFSGICLNCDNFRERHGSRAFALCETAKPFYGMLNGRIADQSKYGERMPDRINQKSFNLGRVKAALKRLPLLGRSLVVARACWQEFRHWIQGYRFLRTQDIVIVSGGGQLNEEWGGPWGQPFALFKWAVLALLARIPYAITSVGVGKVTSKT